MPAPKAMRSKGYVESFDALTLIYDCFYDDRARQVVLVCPRLINLWPVLRNNLRLDGEPARKRLRRSKHLRVEVLRLSAPRRPAFIEVGIGDASHEVPVGSQEFDLFAGRNVLMAISKDNPVEWIEDWARYHISAHGADGLLLIDNGSSLYSPAALQGRLAAIPGLAVCRVIPAPFPYGGPGGGRLHLPAKFLQTSMFNLAQLRFLHRARAVLSVDIDELVWPGAGSIFDAAAGSAFGMVSFFGHWVYPASGGSAKLQRDHGFRLGRKIIPNPKWCIVPDSLAGQFSWAIHRPAGLLYPLSIRRRFGFWHCYATSTSWKHNRKREIPDLSPCSELAEAIRQHLPSN